MVTGHLRGRMGRSYRVNGHHFEVIETYDRGREIVRCTECLARELIDDEDDPEDYLGRMTPECRIVWLREPDGGFHGVALRNAQHFRGRELISVKEDGSDVEVANKIRVYDDDASHLASILDQRRWEAVQ